jgi:glucose 1-dehydrogenase
MFAIAAFPDQQVPRKVALAPPVSPAAGQLLCRTRHLGICGTDREILLSRRPALPPGEEFLVLGHECLGEVVEVGPDMNGRFAAGDLVVPVVRRALPHSVRRPDMLAPGEYTERGIFFEHGFSAPYWLDRAEYLVAVPASIADVAVLAEPLAVVEKGVHEAELLQSARLGETAWPAAAPRVLVTGLGPIAFAAVLATGARGWPTTVLGRDRPDTFRAELAARLGATYRDLRTLPAEPADAETDGFDLILECTGSDDVLVQTSPFLASCGLMVWLGSSRVPQARSHNLALVMRNAVIRNHLHLGTVNAALRDFQAALDDLRFWCRRSAADVAAIITERLPLDEALWHYTHRRPQGIKCVVDQF